jgi:hypothetical protein
MYLQFEGVKKVRKKLTWWWSSLADAVEPVDEIVADVGDDGVGVGHHEARQLGMTGLDKVILEKSPDPEASFFNISSSLSVNFCPL